MMFYSKTIISDSEKKNEVFAELLNHWLVEDKNLKLKVMEICGFQTKIKVKNES